MCTAEHDIGSLARQGQLILDKRFNVLETSLDQVAGQDVQTALPATDLRRWR